MKISKNKITQIVSWIILAFTFSGFAGDPKIWGEAIVNNLSNGQFLGLLTFIAINGINLGIHWYEQLKEDPSKFWLFLKSHNFWLTGANILGGILLVNTGINISEETFSNFISLIFSEDYWEAGSLFVANILLPIVKSLVNKKVNEVSSE